MAWLLNIADPPSLLRFCCWPTLPSPVRILLLLALFLPSPAHQSLDLDGVSAAVDLRVQSSDRGKRGGMGCLLCWASPLSYSSVLYFFLVIYGSKLLFCGVFFSADLLVVCSFHLTLFFEVYRKVPKWLQSDLQIKGSYRLVKNLFYGAAAFRLICTPSYK